MKALKAKRASLRSFLSMGLVILSILALAIAFAGCGNGNNGDNGGNGPGVPPPPPPPTPPPAVVTEIILLDRGPGTWVGFQGLPPDLTGTVVRVSWSNGDVETRQLTAADAQHFSTSPVAPDFWATPGDYRAVSNPPFSIVHSSSNVGSNPFTFQQVIPLNRLNVVGGTNVVWFADRSPEFIDDLTLEGFWSWRAEANDASLAGGLLFDGAEFGEDPFTVADVTFDGVVRQRTATIPLTMTYPHLDMSRLVEDQTIWVRIGLTDSTPRYMVSDAEAPIRIAQFLEVAAVTHGALPAAMRLLDDQFVDTHEFTPAAIERFLLGLVDQYTPTFTIHYEGSPITRTISWLEFQSNRAYFQTLTGQVLPYLFVGHDRLLVDDDDFRLLDWDEDTATWGFVLSYVGRLTPGGHGVHTAMVDVRLPVFEFTGPLTVARTGIQQNVTFADAPPNLAMDADSPGFPANMLGDREQALFNVLRERWVVSGGYTRLGTTLTIPIPMTPMMFINEDGEVPLWPNDDTGFEIDAGPLSAGEFLSNWPIILHHRGETTEEEATVLINVLGTGFALEPLDGVYITAGFGGVTPIAAGSLWAFASPTDLMWSLPPLSSGEFVYSTQWFRRGPSATSFTLVPNDEGTVATGTDYRLVLRVSNLVEGRFGITSYSEIDVTPSLPTPNDSVIEHGLIEFTFNFSIAP